MSQIAKLPRNLAMAGGVMQSLSCATGHTAGGRKKDQDSLRGVGQLREEQSRISHSDPLKVRCCERSQINGANHARGVSSPFGGLAHGLRAVM